MHFSVPVKSSLNVHQVSDAVESSAHGCSWKIYQPPAAETSESLLAVGRVCPLYAVMSCLPVAVQSWPRAGEHLEQLWYPRIHSLGMSEINREGRNAEEYSELSNSPNLVPDRYISPNFGDLALKPQHRVSFLTCNKDNAASMSYITTGISMSTDFLWFFLCCCYLGAFTFQVGNLEKQSL